MFTLVLISLGVFLIYTTTVVSMFGVPTSLSDSFYLLNKKKEGLGYLFSLTLFTMAFTLLPPWLSLPIGGDYEVIKFFCCALLGFVGAAPRFNEEDSGWHTVFAMGAAVLGLLWIVLFTPHWYIIIAYLILFVGLMFDSKTKNCYIFWLEMVMFFSVYNVLILLYLK
jgi:hypothetical protein